jgi:RHS repeat-associated protein
VAGDTKYEFTGYYKCLNTATTSARVSIRTLDADGNQLDLLHLNLPNATSWSPFSFKFTTHPNAVKIQLLVRLHGKAGQAVLYDSVRLKLDSPVESDSYSYTGKNIDKATQLVYFGARYYDPEVGRFITEDPAKDGVNWFVYCRNNPLRFVDPTGLAAGDRYDSMDKAAIEWAMEWNGQSINRDREYGSTIYMIEDEDGNIWYGYTKPREGSRRAVIPSKGIPKGAKPVARIHSHGGFDPTLGHCNWTFSDNDRLGNEVEYVATPTGYLVKWDPSTGEKIPMSTGIPSDPAAGIYRVNNIDPPNPNDSFAYNLNFTIDFRSKIEGLLRGWGW